MSNTDDLKVTASASPIGLTLIEASSDDFDSLWYITKVLVGYLKHYQVPYEGLSMTLERVRYFESMGYCYADWVDGF